MSDKQTRYSDKDLKEFEALVRGKIEKSTEELIFTKKQIKDLSENGFNQGGGDWFDDSTSHTDLQMLQRMATRQEQFLGNLKNALYRIEKKTFGICSVTGKLIDKKRLLIVPHATKSMIGKDIDKKAHPVKKGPDTMARFRK